MHSCSNYCNYLVPTTLLVLDTLGGLGPHYECHIIVCGLGEKGKEEGIKVYHISG